MAMTIRDKNNIKHAYEGGTNQIPVCLTKHKEPHPEDSNFNTCWPQ
jgi:hypothetical protein